MPATFYQTNNDLAGTLQQIGGSIVKAVNDRMEQKMTEVQKEAVKRAPLDHGDLEKAIKLDKNNQRRSWTVYVDESMPDDTGKYTIGDYATWLHEAVYELGPKSRAKGLTDGRKYLENPFREIITQKLLDELKALLQTELNARAARRGSR